MKSLLTLFFLFNISVLFAQNKDSVSSSFKKMHTEYIRKRIHDTIYMRKVKEFSTDIILQGLYIKPNELREYLKTYEKIAFSNKEYEKYRIDYYRMFLSNAALFQKRGEAMYFAEKVTREYALQNQHSLSESAHKIKIFVTSANIEKVIQVYNKEKNFLKRIPYLLSKDSIKSSIAIDAFHILSPVSSTYSQLGDSKNLSEIYDLSIKIINELKKKKLDSNDLLSIDLHLLEQKFFISFVNKDYKSSSSILNEVEKLKNKYKTDTTWLDYALTEWKIDFYLKANKVDSVEYYLKKYNNIPQISQDIKERILSYSAQVNFIKGNYKEAYEQLQKANVIGDSIKTNLTGELDDLLYSYTKAEDTQNALILAEKTKSNQRLLFISISIVFVIIIFLIIWIRIRKNRIIKNKISDLNNIANIQIATIEEMTFQAVKKEQIRLGEDLHNSTGSSLSAIKYQIETLLMDSNSTDSKSQLTKILEHITDVYNNTRNKSHEWYSLSENKAEILFYQQVYTNLELFFPSNRFNKKVEIDQNVLEDISSVQKIELLKVIQEALSNIIKHTKARTVSLMIFRENDNSFALIIKNDGKFNIKKESNGLGLKSITSRIINMNGSVQINTEDGFEVYINIPIT